MFKLFTAINDQTRPAIYGSPRYFPDGRCTPFPTQAYEEGLNSDEALDAALTRWGIPVGHTGMVMLDIERRILPPGTPVQTSDFVDERVDPLQMELIITAITRVKRLRPTAKVGQRCGKIVSGWGTARTAADLAMYHGAFDNMRAQNDKYIPLFRAADLHRRVAVERRGDEVRGEVMDFDLRDAEAMDECERVRKLAGAGGQKCAVLFAVGAPFYNRIMTGANIPIQPGAMLGPFREAKRRGWGGGIWWGNIADQREYDWMNEAHERIKRSYEIYFGKPSMQGAVQANATTVKPVSISPGSTPTPASIPAPQTAPVANPTPDETSKPA